ncbi:hypothetical protein TIFTF001_053834, partial [Ficus carica]
MTDSGSASEHKVDDQPSENGQRNNVGMLAMAIVAMTASRRKRRRAPQPMHNSTLTGSQWVAEILNGHEEIIQDLIRMKSDTFRALSDLLGATNRHISYLFQHSRETTSRCFFKVLTAICALKDEFIRPADYTGVQPIITEHSYKYRPWFD